MAFINETHLLANAYFDDCTYSIEVSSMAVAEYSGKCKASGSVHEGLRADLQYNRPVGLAISSAAVLISLGDDLTIISIGRQSGYGSLLVETPESVHFLHLSDVNNLLYMSLEHSIAVFPLDQTSANLTVIARSQSPVVDVNIDFAMDFILLDENTLLVTEMQKDEFGCLTCLSFARSSHKLTSSI